MFGYAFFFFSHITLSCRVWAVLEAADRKI